MGDHKLVLAMATLSVIARAQHSIRYDLVSVSELDVASRTQAQMIADCAPGPLKNYLASLTPLQFSALRTDPKVDVQSYSAESAPPFAAPNVNFVFGTMQAASMGPNFIVEGTIDIIFRHTVSR